MESKKALPFCRGFRHRMSEKQNGYFKIKHPGTGEILFLTVTL